ncbi:MAG: DNA repair protein RecO [Clostridia bacterium]|nr:DNA repair protein RecO [Clostridia bacterium]
MSNTKINGIILSENNLGDFDKMLTMLTPGVGKISCVAKGARRPKSALLAGTQMFCFGEYLVYKGSNTYHINSVEPIEVFYNIRTDLDKLKYAVHINKIIQDVTHENQNCYNILQLLLNTLYTISETDKNLDLVLSVFKLRLLCILGFTPKLTECTNCKEKEKLNQFSIRDNGVKCEICSKQDKSTINMSESTANAIKYVVTAPAKKLYSFNIKDESLEEFKLITKIYFNDKLEKEYKLEDLF